MIHIVTNANRHLYRAQVWEMFNERRKAFYERCGWRDLMVFDGAEVDDFDDEKAVYLLALDEEERLEGAVRARPTDDRCILADKYPQMIGPDAPPLKGPDVWETTRIFTTDRYRARREKGDKRAFEIGLASAELIVDAGGLLMVGMIDLHLLPMLDDTGGDVHLAGPPMPYAYGTMVGTWTPLDEAEIERMRDGLGFAPVRLSYEVDDEDFEAFGSLAAIQRAVDAARAFGPRAPSDVQALSLKSIAQITALYAKHDAALAEGAEPSDLLSA
jgi:acyl-homoserine lactone synthase